MFSGTLLSSLLVRRRCAQLILGLVSIQTVFYICQLIQWKYGGQENYIKEIYTQIMQVKLQKLRLQACNTYFIVSSYYINFHQLKYHHAK